MNGMQTEDVRNGKARDQGCQPVISSLLYYVGVCFHCLHQIWTEKWRFGFPLLKCFCGKEGGEFDDLRHRHTVFGVRLAEHFVSQFMEIAAVEAKFGAVCLVDRGRDGHRQIPRVSGGDLFKG
jgi:hypothetical protein